MNQKNIEKLVSEVFAIEAETAKQAGALGYMARAMVQATLPHSKVIGNEFSRKNGSFILTILSSNNVGVPYGTIPRLLLSWIATEAVRKKDRNLVLGKTLSSFMTKLELIPTGGRWGNITRLKDQMARLFSASISCTYDDGNHWAIQNINPISKADLWWNPQQPDQVTTFESTLTISEEFFKEITNNPVPIDIRILQSLKRSPLALDIYFWLTYRLSYLRHTTIIPWEVLQLQFGADYATDLQGVRNFKRAFLRELKRVHIFYKEAKLEFLDGGLKLKPSISHIKKLTIL